MDERRYVHGLLPIAEEAWKSPKQGAFEVGGKKVFKNKKMVIIISDYFPFVHITAFPKPEHSETLMKSSGSTKGGGPARDNPGAIGTIRIVGSEGWTGVEPNEMRLDWAQSHYKTGEGGLPRNLASFYGGWREQCLKAAVQYAHSTGRPLVIDSMTGSAGRLLTKFPFFWRKTQFVKETEKVSRELVVKLEKKGILPWTRKITIRPK